jgi:branched-chain amino acid transport system permease protein
MIEMIYHLQLNSAWALRFHGRDLQPARAEQLVWPVFVLLTGLGLFEVARRQFVREWGADPGIHRKGNQAKGGISDDARPGT